MIDYAPLNPRPRKPIMRDALLDALEEVLYMLDGHKPLNTYAARAAIAKARGVQS